ncbi:MAG: hypothetical protein ABII88_00835 [Candidatus Omnitrophota bacterium]
MQLHEFQVSEIPFFGSIENLQGNIIISQNSIISEDIEGTINNAPATLVFKLDDLNSPKLSLNAKLTPLTVDLICSLAEEKLDLKSLEAKYNKIKLRAQGNISNLKTQPTVDLNADINLNLADLTSLPLEIKPLLLKINPQGLLDAKLKVSGQVKDIAELNANMVVQSQKMTFDNYNIDNLNINVSLLNGLLEITQGTAEIFESKLKIQAICHLMETTLPFTTTIALTDLKVENLAEKFPAQQSYSGNINAELSIKGNAVNPNNLELDYTAAANNIIFEKIALPFPVKSSGNLTIKNLVDIFIKDIQISDSTIALKAAGSVTNISSPFLDISGGVRGDIKDLIKYDFLNLPENLSLLGIPEIRFSLKGPVSALDKMRVPFQITSEEIKINQLSINKCNLQGLFEQMMITISTLSADLYGGSISADGNIALTSGNAQEFQANVNLKNMDTEQFAIQTKLIPLGFKGMLSSRLNIMGKGLDPKSMDAKILLTSDIENASAQEVSIGEAQLSSNINYENTNLEVLSLDLIYKNIELKAKGRIKALLDSPQLDLSVETSLDLADLKTLPIKLPAEVAELKLAGTLRAQLEAQGPFANTDWTKLKINARALSDKITIKDIAINNIDINATYADSILNGKAQADSYDGTITANLTADLLKFPKDFTYKGTAQINNLNFGMLIAESKIIPQPHRGIASVNADISGVGQSLNTLSGTIEFNTKEIVIAKQIFLENIFGLLKGLGIAFNPLKATQASGTLIIKNSEVYTENTELICPDGKMQAKGTVTFFQNLKDFFITIILSDSGAAKTNQNILEKSFTFDTEKYSKTIPIEGTLTKPNMEKALKEEALKQAQTQVLDKFIDKEKNPLLNKAAGKLLEGLFK